MAEKKSKGQELYEQLSYDKKNYFETASEEEKKAMFAFAEEYKAFLDEAKTEREACAAAVRLAEGAGFTEYKFGDALRAGDKRYFVNRGKSVVAFRIGSEDLEKDGMRLIVSHIDAPRIDIKQNPLYEEAGMCFLKTHYYGGIKKYQWTAMPLALHGVVVRKDGTKAEIRIGEDPADPVFYIDDLLPHLGGEQMAKTGGKIIEGEQLNVVVGGMPYADEKVDKKLKLTVLSILREKYGICEEDFLSAELSAVPAYPARDIGFDRALIGAYGHDDRVCAYPALRAVLDESSRHTVLAMLVDKEEIGSEGSTGMQCKIYEDLMEEISLALGANFRKVRFASKCLSSDVTAAYDPNFAGMYERMNAAMLSCGTCMSKFTGARGKSGSNDASAEFVGELRAMFAKEGVVWQTAELGKVDGGGGGTVAKFLANLNIDTVDIGVPVISMHAPWELISKADLYSNYRAFLAFLK
ncbi:MAG TPA: aminopeptidase [Candidatus Borkfalkia avicola]|uniref:M18 family aminopeptidase n=1 Tax=Candidatus Borkfalkia avicola TaxID=2838503 RepID=A0A9D2D697_9FIRM|nr:aminopeptidase [Candidatus Borkfalkia avicola]